MLCPSPLADIKLENVVLDGQGQVKLCDFGLSIDQKFERANSRLGTFGYFAPEVGLPGFRVRV